MKEFSSVPFQLKNSSAEFPRHVLLLRVLTLHRESPAEQALGNVTAGVGAPQTKETHPAPRTPRPRPPLLAGMGAIV